MAMHLAGARAAWVTIITLLLVSILSAIDILFGRLEGATAGALRTTLLCLVFILVAYLLFEAKLVELLYHLAGGHYEPPPISFVGTLSPGSSVGRGLSSEEEIEEAIAGDRDAASPAPLASGYTETESGYVADEPSPPFFSGGYSRRRPPTTRRSRTTTRSRSSSSETSNLTSDEDADDDASSTALPRTRGGEYNEYEYLYIRHRYAPRQAEADERRRYPGGGIKSHKKTKPKR